MTVRSSAFRHWWLAVAIAGAALLVVSHSSAGGSQKRSARATRHLAPTARLMSFPQSVSFVSASTGWVWGPTAWPVGGRSQGGMLARTDDGGRTWRDVGAPPVAWSAAGQIRFVDSRRGYLFGPQLWYTADGGLRWRRMAARGPVVDIEGHGAREFALVVPMRSDNQPLGKVYVERLTGARLRIVLTTTSSNSTALAVHGSTVLLLASRVLADGRLKPASLWLSHDLGTSWAHRSAPCLWGGEDGFALTAWSDNGLALACGSQPGAGSQSKTVYASADGGRTWQRRRSEFMSPGYVGSLAALSARVWVMAAIRDAALQITHDGGRTWTSPASTAFSGEWWGPLSLFGGGEGRRRARDAWRPVPDRWQRPCETLDKTRHQLLTRAGLTDASAGGCLGACP